MQPAQRGTEQPARKRNMHMALKLSSTSGKIVASLALVGAAASVSGLGTYGSFTSTTSADAKVDAGTVKIDLNSGGGFSINASGIVPGDSIQRQATLSNTGTADLGSISLTTVASTSSVLDTDTTNGLKLQITSCPSGWTTSATGANTCSTAPVTVLAASPIIGSNVPLPNLAALKAGGEDNLLVTASLPDTAGDVFQGQTSAIRFDFVVTQRAAGVR